MSEAQPAGTEMGNRDAALAALYDDVHRGHMFPFWATTTDVAHDEIKQLMGSRGPVPYLWRYESEIEPLLRRGARTPCRAFGRTGRPGHRPRSGARRSSFRWRIPSAAR